MITQLDTWSQFGEDRWIAEHYATDIAGIFVDVGASDGVTGSNSWMFEQLGWWCLCIEPDPRQRERLSKARAVCEFVAVSHDDGTEKLWLHPTRPSRSSLVPSEDVAYQPTEVKTVTLARLCDQYHLRHIDILDIDVEGHELAVWASLDLTVVRPSVVLIEYADGRPRSSYVEIFSGISASGYDLVHRTKSNLIFESKLNPMKQRII